jgi:hypothetical protein
VLSQPKYVLSDIFQFSPWFFRYFPINHLMVENPQKMEKAAEERAKQNFPEVTTVLS